MMHTYMVFKHFIHMRTFLNCVIRCLKSVPYNNCTLSFTHTEYNLFSVARLQPRLLLQIRLFAQAAGQPASQLTYLPLS